MKKKHIRFPIWDIPTRLFHWLLVTGCIVSWLSFELGYLEIHAYSGYTILSLLLFRIVWGFIGSTHSRFKDFVKGPQATIAYLRKQVLAESVGHNPLGAWSVLVLLGGVLIQAVSGLFNSDDILFDGPYKYAVDETISDWFSALHAQLFYYLLGFIALHIAAVAYYDLVKGQGLTRAMATGHKARQTTTEKPASLALALVVMLVCAASVILLVYLAPKPEIFY